ncbi:MAG: single-stranded-DNA-specific exonuclease RecJ [Clostridia bacterium]|nr:single-stranded-DNA-specific exonuclease RecJ [Clostridia bacterium]
MSFRRWTFAPLDKSAAAQVASACEIDGFLALLLSARGCNDPEEAAALLSGEEELGDPFAFADMDAAVERIQQAIDTGETIAVFGDYDADGVTATVLLYTYLTEKGANVFYRIPRREDEGYGLHPSTVDEIAQKGATLLVTVDNGISAVDEIAYAKTLGMDVVVTDHHQPQGVLPAAVAVVDPHREDCESEYKDYAGVGVAYKLVCALEGDDDWALSRYADLVALGTLADVMPLVGENRRLVREGLEKINRGDRAGLAALGREAGAQNRPQTAGSVVFTLAPRINAAGRMGDPDAAAQLLLSEAGDACDALAAKIAAYNTERQKKESDILKEVMAYIEAHPEVLRQRVIVLAGDDWYSGVVGIIAARVLEKYGKPSILLSVQDGIAKGSGRSVPGFSLFDAIASCEDMLLNYGGHQLAAGLGLKAEDVDTFRRRINEYAAREYPEMPVAELAMDFRLVPSQIHVDKLDAMERLEPFGAGNPAPLFGLFHMTVENTTEVAGKHTRLTLSKDGAVINAIRFGATPSVLGLETGDKVHLAVTLDRNEFRGTVSVSVIVKDIRYADTVQEDMIAAAGWFDRVMCGETLTAQQTAKLTPTRDHVAAVYRLLKAKNGYDGTWERWHHLLGDAVPCHALRPAVEVLCQAGLVTAQYGGDSVKATLVPVSGKADLMQTPLMKQLMA